MDKKPEALRLADLIDNDLKNAAHHEDAAAELRRLHAENKALREANDTFASERILPDHLVIVEKAEVEALREALQQIASIEPTGADDRACALMLAYAVHQARDAIAKATGEQA